MKTAKRAVLDRLVRLTFLLTVGWVLCFWPARVSRPEHGVLWMTVAAVSCLVAGWFVVLLECLRVFQEDMILILGQMSVRVAGFAGVALTVRWLFPDLGLVDFYIWLIAFYLLAMVYEVFLLREKFSSQQKSPVESSQS